MPEPIEEKLYPLATGLRGATDEDSLRNICNYLREHYRYSLETKSSENMTENFLFESHRGYCVHFSTAAALLARTLDIPVRIAEGFILQIPETEDDYGIPSSYGRSTAYVTGFSAHQWPEVLSGGSWVPWEVTPPYTEFSEKTRDRTPSYDRYTQKQLESLGLEEISPVEKDTQRMNIPFMTRIFSASLVPFALALSVVLLISYRNRYSETTVRRKLKRLVKKGNRILGLPSPEETGWVAWFGFCTLKTRCQNSPEQEFQNLILKFQYGNDPLDPDEKKKLILYIRNLMKIRNQKSIGV